MNKLIWIGIISLLCGGYIAYANHNQSIEAAKLTERNAAFANCATQVESEYNQYYPPATLQYMAEFQPGSVLTMLNNRQAALRSCEATQ